MQPIQRMGTPISGFCLPFLILLLGAGGCTRTEKSPVPAKAAPLIASSRRTAGPAGASAQAPPTAAKTPKQIPAEQSAAAQKPTPNSEDTRPMGPPAASGFSNAKQSPQLRKDKKTDKKKEADEEIEKEGDLRREELKKYIASLGEPLVEHPEELQRVHPWCPLWMDLKRKQVVLLGQVCQTEAPLEMFACQRGTKEHEAILSVPLPPPDTFLVHAALLRIGAKSGHPAQFGPGEGQYSPAAGTKIEITVRWKDDRGTVQTARAQDWINNMRTGKPLNADWVFAGSAFWKDETTGKEYYQADGGDFICVSNFAAAMLDLPIESSQANADLLFQANSRRVPPRGTAVTVILRPKLPGKGKKTNPRSGTGVSEREKKPGKTSDGSSRSVGSVR
jgi:hypothetical protein